MKKNLLKLFLLAAVLIVGAGEMWGAYYWKGSAVPVGSGKVAMRQANVAAGAIDNWSASRVDSNFTTTATGYKYARYYAQPDEGKYFWGWYTDSECTEDSYFPLRQRILVHTMQSLRIIPYTNTPSLSLLQPMPIIRRQQVETGVCSR